MMSRPPSVLNRSSGAVGLGPVGVVDLATRGIGPLRVLGELARRGVVAAVLPVGVDGAPTVDGVVVVVVRVDLGAVTPDPVEPRAAARLGDIGKGRTSDTAQQSDRRDARGESFPRLHLVSSHL